MFFCLNVFEAIKFAPKVIHLKGQLPAPYGPTYSWDWKRILFHPPPLPRLSAARRHPVDKFFEQHCYKSAAALVQLVRFYMCTKWQTRK